MSFAVTQACRPLQLPATQKAVLMCLADYCHDDGKDWHSIAAIVEWTCLAKRTVIDALKGLEAGGFIAIQRSLGTRNTTMLQLERIAEAAEYRCASRTSAPAAPVHQPHWTSAPAAPPPVREPHQQVQEPHPKHQEASEKHQGSIRKKTRGRAPACPAPDGVDQHVWADWLVVRKAKRGGPVTATALDGLRREAGRAGIGIEDAVRFCVEANWVGFNAGWYADRMTKRGSGGGDYAAPHRTSSAAQRSTQPDLAELTAAVKRRLGIAPTRSTDETYREVIADDGRIL